MNAVALDDVPDEAVSHEDRIIDRVEPALHLIGDGQLMFFDDHDVRSPMRFVGMIEQTRSIIVGVGYQMFWDEWNEIIELAVAPFRIEIGIQLVADLPEEAFHCGSARPRLYMMLV